MPSIWNTSSGLPYSSPILQVCRTIVHLWQNCTKIRFRGPRHGDVDAMWFPYFYSKKSCVVRIDLIVFRTFFYRNSNLTRNVFEECELDLYYLFFVIFGCHRWVFNEIGRRWRRGALLLIRLLLNVLVSVPRLSYNRDFCMLLHQRGDTYCKYGWWDEFVYPVLTEVLAFGQLSAFLFIWFSAPTRYIGLVAA